MSGIYALLRQAQISILEIFNIWMPVPLYLSGVVDPPEADRLPPLRVRDLRLELEHKLPFFKGLIKSSEKPSTT